LGVAISNWIGTYAAYNNLAKVVTLKSPASRTNEAFFGSAKITINTCVTFFLVVFGALAWILMIARLIGFEKYQGLEQPVILYSVAFGPSLAITGLWLVYILWIGALGNWYTEFTREILNRLLGYLTISALLWAAVGEIVTRLGSKWLYSYSWNLPQGYGLIIVGGVVTVAVCFELVLRHVRRLREMSPQYPKDGQKSTFFRLTKNIISWGIVLLSTYMLTIVYQYVLLRYVPNILEMAISRDYIYLDQRVAEDRMGLRFVPSLSLLILLLLVAYG
jgi:hypothetical protein